MSFAHPEFLWLLTLVPVLLLWAIRGRLRRVRAWEVLGQRGQVPSTGSMWWLGSIACMIVAMAQPRWGRLASEPLPPGHDAILLVDVSRSMAVEDAVPNRLAVAVESAQRLVEALALEPANRAAVVAFAGRGVLRCPLTENLGAVLDVLRNLRPGGVRPDGTDLGAGLEVALEAVPPQEHAQGQAIVVFSDGEDHAERWRPRLERLRNLDVVVHAVLIGEADQDHPVPSGIPGTPLLYHGQPALSRRVDTALEEVARQTGGAVVRLGLASADLGALYRTRIEPAARQRRESSRLGGRVDQFPLFLMAAVVMLFAGCWPPGRGWWWRGTWSWRRTDQTLGRGLLPIAVAAAVSGASQSPPPEPRKSQGEAAPASSSPPVTRPDSAAELVERGRAAYDERRWDAALAAFDQAILRAPDAAVPRFNAAAALFRLGHYEDARRRYLESRLRADASLRTKIDYALGNTALALSDIPGAIGFYDQCIASTAPGAALDAVRHDARINRAFAYQQQAQSLAVPQGQSSSDSPKSRRSDRQQRAPNRQLEGEEPEAQGQPETGPSESGPRQEDQSGKPASRDRPPRRYRRVGGAGGSRSTPPNSPGESPVDRLDTALEHIRAAQSRRLPDEPPPDTANNDRRNW
jgi:Ca-activated chloride channel family protein